jgi:hypothetical protein
MHGWRELSSSDASFQHDLMRALADDVVGGYSLHVLEHCIKSWGGFYAWRVTDDSYPGIAWGLSPTC